MCNDAEDNMRERVTGRLTIRINPKSVQNEGQCECKQDLNMWWYGTRQQRYFSRKKKK